MARPVSNYVEARAYESPAPDLISRVKAGLKSEWTPEMAYSVALNVATLPFFFLKAANVVKAGIACGTALWDNREAVSRINWDHLLDSVRRNPWGAASAIGATLLVGGAGVLFYPQATERALSALFTVFLASTHVERSVASLEEKRISGLLKNPHLTDEVRQTLARGREALLHEIGGSMGELGLFLAVSGTVKLAENPISRFLKWQRVADLLAGRTVRPQTIGAWICMGDDVPPLVSEGMDRINNGLLS